MKLPPGQTIDYYLLPNKIFCNIVGMWPSDEKRSVCNKIFVCFRVALSLLAISSIFVPQIMLIAANWGDIKILAEVGCVTTSFVQILFKIIYITARREKSCSLYKELKSLWDSTDDPKEKQRYEEFAYWARHCTILFCVSAVVTVSIISISAAFTIKTSDSNDEDRSRELPFQVWYGSDITEPHTLEIACICQVLAVSIIVFAHCGLDTTFVTSILHVSGQFRLIGLWLRNIAIDIKREPTNDLPDNPGNVAATLVNCIRHHQRVIHVVADVNDLLAPIFFIQLLTSGIEICLSGFAVMNSDTNDDLFRSIAWLGTIIVQLFLWCWPSEILIQESLQVGYDITLHVPWYELPPIYQRQLLLIILRSQNYCSISALVLRTVSVHTLTDVFNTAASYFALLRQLDENAELS